MQENPPNFLDRQDVRFKKLHGTCDCIFCKLQESGVGTTKKSAAVITEENEDKLWTTGILNVTHPQGLQKAVFFYVGKVCCLRGEEEQRNFSFNNLATLSATCTLNMAQKIEMVDFFSFMSTIRRC